MLGYILGLLKGFKYLCKTGDNLTLRLLRRRLVLDAPCKLTEDAEKLEKVLDDCFVFGTKGKDYLETFHIILNQLHPNLTFTMEYSEGKLPFLDILLLKYNNKIFTDKSSKETDFKQYLNFHSCHPKHTNTSIPYNLA